MVYFLSHFVIVIVVHSQLLQSCLTLCDPVGYSPPGSPLHGILQARILEWVAMPSSKGSSWPWDWTCIYCSTCTAGRFFTTEPKGKPPYCCTSLGFPKNLYSCVWDSRFSWMLLLYTKWKVWGLPKPASVLRVHLWNTFSETTEVSWRQPGAVFRAAQKRKGTDGLTRGQESRLL